MTTRRNFIKKATLTLAAAPLLTMPQIAQAAEISGGFVLKDINKKNLSDSHLRRWLRGQILRIIKRSKNSEKALAALKDNSRQFDREINRVVKQIGNKPQEELRKRGIKFKVSFEFPPAKLTITLTF